LPWEKAKSFDGSAVIGEFLPKSEFEDLDNINFRLENSGKVVQKANTSLMLWNIDALIEYVSKYFTLKIGDIIFTGTPSGVARIQPNDILTGFIEDKKLFSIKVK
jgi:2-keto-4-pentenoate hydratase/2-oxohepta-3-ene-1,7-dioic acid hydratase in catechol pathway